MLAYAPDTFYIHEPFNVTDPPEPGICSIRMNQWFKYINSNNEKNYYNGLQRTLSFRYNLFRQLAGIRTIKEFKKSLNEYHTFNQGRRNGLRVIIKDPLAFFSAEWLQKKFDMCVIIAIRHPAAFINSLMELGWNHPFNDFIQQKELMNNHLSRYKDQIKIFAASNFPILDQGILLWNIIYSTAIIYSKEHKDWLFIRHEDLSHNPVDEYRKLYSMLNLNFSPLVESRIREYSCSDNSSNSPFEFKRNSLKETGKWKENLSRKDIAKIRKGVSEVSDYFYKDEDWTV